MLGVASLMLGVAIAGNALVSWRVRRATRGMGTQALARMLDFYEGVLRAAREGLILIDADGRVQLVNDEARQLLGLQTVLPGLRSRSCTSGRPCGAAARAGGRRTTNCTSARTVWWW